MKQRLVLLTALGLLALATVLPTTASAGTVYKTTTSVRVTATKVEGKLSSEKAACLKNRQLALRLFIVGGTPGTPFSLKTDGSGNWSTRIDVPENVRGLVEVRVAEKQLGGGKICGEAEKRTPL